MKRNTHVQHPVIQICLMLALALIAPTANATLMVNMTATPLGGGIYHYDLSVDNTGPEEFLIVSIIDAPLNDPLIDPSLMTPAGFLGSYDGGLGFVDFLADTDSFLPATTVSGFSFESLAGPGASFTTFEALDTNLDPVRGTINVRVNSIPETGSTLLMAGLGFAALALARRKLST